MALMAFPFTQEQFLNVFAQYNVAVFPLQIVFVILGIAAVGLAIKKSSFRIGLYLLILSLFLVVDGDCLSHPFLLFHQSACVCIRGVIYC